jgi:hypothetical protein
METPWLSLGLIAASLLGCGGGGSSAGRATDPTPLQVTPAPSATPATTTASSPATAAPPAATTAAPPASASAAAPKPPEPKTAAECKALIAKTPAPVITATDTQVQMREHFQAYHETFRCCFDALFAPQNPGVSGKVALAVDIDASGSFASAEILTAETTVQSTETQACIIEIAKALTYPKPASGKDIRYKRNFDFKARR